MGSLSKIKEVSIILLEKISILQIDTLHHAIYPFTETCTYSGDLHALPGDSRVAKCSQDVREGGGGA